jgi:hypothetical protein
MAARARYRRNGGIPQDEAYNIRYGFTRYERGTNIQADAKVYMIRDRYGYEEAVNDVYELRPQDDTGEFIVSSQRLVGDAYLVRRVGEHVYDCECPDYGNGNTCKHIYAVMQMLDYVSFGY